MSEIVSNHIIVIVHIIIIVSIIIIFLLNRSKPRHTTESITLLGLINNEAFYHTNITGGINKSLKKKYKKLKNIITPFSLNNETF